MQLTIHTVPSGTLGVDVRTIIAAVPHDSTHVIVHIDARDHAPSLYRACTSVEGVAKAWNDLFTPAQADHRVFSVESVSR